MSGPLEGVALGDVLVIRRARWRQSDPIREDEAEVTKIGRKWVTLTSLGQYRYETQFGFNGVEKPNGTNYHDRARTAEGWKEFDALAEAWESLRRRGLDFRMGLRPNLDDKAARDFLDDLLYVLDAHGIRDPGSA